MILEEGMKQFQSLLSQGISLLALLGRFTGALLGRCFNPFLVRASVYWQDLEWRADGESPLTFQSLLSQGISLLGTTGISVGLAVKSGFNPFLVRASVYCRDARYRVLQATYAEFQSLLSQGISLLVVPLRRAGRGGRVGFNPFLVRASVYCKIILSTPNSTWFPWFQSLLSQGISLLVMAT